MLRTAFLRSARPAVARIALRPSSVAVRRASRLAAAPRAVVAPRVLVASRTQVRSYSAGGDLDEDAVYSRISTLLKGFDKVNDVDNITPKAHFANDLGLDSLDTVEVVMAIEEEFSIEIPDKDADSIHSIDQAVKYILNQPDAQ